MLSIFSCVCCQSICISSLVRCLFRSFAHFLIGWGFLFFVFLLLNCISCMSVLELKPLSVASFERIFSHSVGYLFFFLMVSFAVQKVISLIRSHWFKNSSVDYVEPSWRTTYLVNQLLYNRYYRLYWYAIIKITSPLNL